MEKRSILIAEDEIIISLDLKAMLQKNNFKVASIVSTGEALMKDYKLKEPDLVIVDFNLRGEISGIEAIREIRNINNTPIIIISGSTAAKLKKFCTTIPNCKFLIKPYEDSELLKLINSFLPSNN